MFIVFAVSLCLCVCVGHTFSLGGARLYTKVIARHTVLVAGAGRPRASLLMARRGASPHLDVTSPAPREQHVVVFIVVQGRHAREVLHHASGVAGGPKFRDTLAGAQV